MKSERVLHHDTVWRLEFVTAISELSRAREREALAKGCKLGIVEQDYRRTGEVGHEEDDGLPLVEASHWIVMLTRIASVKTEHERWGARYGIASGSRKSGRNQAEGIDDAPQGTQIISIQPNSADNGFHSHGHNSGGDRRHL